MKIKEKNKLIPQLRFPEFKDSREWEIKPLGDISKKLTEKTKGRKFKLMSITAGEGLVSQFEKFGREIAGNSYKNYYVIHKNDFAYNKSSTKYYPQGEIAMYEDEEIGAVPNSIFTCFRFNTQTIYPAFAKYHFINNLHGKWLLSFITIGARAHGALQINEKDLFSLPFSFPSLPEQQKIAAFLSNLDELIEAHKQKLKRLKQHKKGLMQNLFPQEGEKVPKYRFPEFRDSGEWVEKKLGEICKLVRGPFGGALKKEIFVKDGFAVYEQSHAIYGKFDSFRYFINDEKFSKLKRFSVNSGDLIMSCSGTMGKFAVIPKQFKKGVINQALLKLTVEDDYDNLFIKLILETEFYQNKLLSQSAGGAIKNVVSVSQIKELNLYIPTIQEQQKIASCLSSIDETITAEAERIEQMEKHKKGLMQNLFPQEINSITNFE